MKNNLPPSAVFGIIGAVVVVAGVGLFFGLRDTPPTTKVAPAGNARPAPPPSDGPMPAWALEKLHKAEADQKR